MDPVIRCVRDTAFTCRPRPGEVIYLPIGVFVSTPDVSSEAGASAKNVTGSSRVKRGMAEMLKGGVIMDVVNAEQARIAEDAGAVAVMALERVPADIRAQGGVSRMSDPDMIDKIIAAPSPIRRSASPRLRQPQTNGTVKSCL